MARSHLHLRALSTSTAAALAAASLLAGSCTCAGSSSRRPRSPHLAYYERGTWLKDIYVARSIDADGPPPGFTCDAR